ncbi:hypothetical protein LUZ61_000143 [Rhynchospora tenuis]|uniref:Sialate O-acetylesterase domain-containing protein n=1 Tax=Rhynchospora tenuis TaxID=198213 RepID=A0AAD5ZEK9_9POAL|nr:hypothetical protein LUZ61_000143 [Rhynchospora tenuis]
MKKQVFILAGQSNMSGRGGVSWYHGRYHWDGVVPEECAPCPSILRLSHDLDWEEARDPLHIDVESKSKTCGVGPGMSFANNLLKEMGCDSPTLIGLVPCAVGGTSIEEWKKGSKLYNHMVQRAKAAEEIGDGGEVKAVLWYQGESDTESDHAAEIYGDHLKKFIEDLRSDLGLPYLPFIQVALASGSGTQRNIEKVRKAQLGLNLPNLTCVDAMGLTLNPDHLHLTTQAQVKLGQMLSEAYIKLQPSSTILFNRKLTKSQETADLSGQIYQDDPMCDFREIQLTTSTRKGKYFSNNCLLSLYQNSRCVVSLLMASILLLYSVYCYCC